MATVHLPRSLVTLFPDPPPRMLEVDTATLDALIDELDARWSGMRDRLCDSAPAIRVHINVFVNGERTRDLATALAPDDVVHVIPAVAGGRQLE